MDPLSNLKGWSLSDDQVLSSEAIGLANQLS